MSTTHWLGAGLSTVPGIRRLAGSSSPLLVWNRTVDKAEAAVRGTTGAAAGTTEYAKLDLSALSRRVQPGDVVVSMLPGDWHVRIAELCLDRGANFVSSSYTAPQIAALNEQVKKAGLCFVNEVGLDPGIDHLFAHALVHDYRQSSEFSVDNRVLFRSYCGGFPAIANDFRYKFSWSPFGVLKALKSPAQWIENGKTHRISTPWNAITDYTARTKGGTHETYEAYPNRDSLPFMNDYQFDKDWHVEQFVRGTLRLAGWSNAWQALFAEIDTLDGEAGTARLNQISDELWARYAYQSGEFDRVVLCVELEARDKENQPIWHQSRSVDDCGNADSSAMARLVSLTVSLAVDSVKQGQLTPGVQAAPHQEAIVSNWLTQLSSLNNGLERTDLLATN